MDKDRIIQYIFMIVFTSVFILLIYGICTLKYSLPQPIKKQLEKNKSIIISDTFSENILMHELKLNQIKFPEIVYGQARLETGNFKSKYFKERNNLFGFRARNGYMHFRDWRHCVVYYANWQKKHYKSGDYYQFLIDINYAEDTSYIKKLKRCIR